jgi:hypothetical protein
MQARAIAHAVIGEAQSANLAIEQGSQPLLALDEGQLGYALAVQEQQIEDHEHQGIGAAFVHGRLQAAEGRDAIRTDRAQLTVEIGRLHRQGL